ncbi:MULTISPECIES: helix-turn-helix domain-containing protein [Acinetobacter]|uniref:AraC family transcriptional regulator n=1 Tax=Acinetobacter seifertii TaxID=1530123 RepID=A0A2M8MJH8_9GAMM|nr:MULTISPECIES: AraC family transcriptional regulator [Acinetobacter]KHO16419.1 transcriptional regulator [Acinetobacter baumannii]MCH2002510.1 AraC family transcriptional regulator [Acinetobacter seifertii]NUF83585.1 helix-turn-helix transcriptional regulator [Acinetobacter seifertii]ONN51329.1 transcriptional regulator [Acinetobacter genomosp. 33YU]PJF04368.1 AraC family transcriptional regulator [Acinetobacter seifertii]
MLISSEWFSINQIECSRTIACNDAYPRHVHDEYVISANISGIEEIWLNGKQDSVKAKQVTIYNPTSIQSSRFSNNQVEFFSIHLPQCALRAFVSENNIYSSNTAPVLKEGIIKNTELFNAIISFNQKDDSPFNKEQQLLLLLGQLVEDKIYLDAQAKSAVLFIQEYMRAHLTAKLSLDELAHMSGLSKYYFVRAFKQHVGMPPLQYHMQLRLNAARNLLRNNMNSVEAAMSLGFYDQSHFIHAFRKTMGVTPHHYLTQINSGKNKFFIT